MKIAIGSTTRNALTSAGISLGELDKVQPDLSAVLEEGAKVKVTRVREEYYVEQAVIPFVHQEIKNEALPEGDRRLSQPGENGLKEITYRRVFEDGVKVSDTEFKSEVVKEAVPEVEMIGSRTQFESFEIPGKIAYLSAGNAWIIAGDSTERELVVNTGDLDGRIFSLSKDGNYLLFTRTSKAEYTINTLWVAVLESYPVQLVDLQAANVVLYAEFSPASDRVTYSTVEWREASPGWQANNDIYQVEINATGEASYPRQILGASSGGVYGWWGTEFSLSPDSSRFLFMRPDRIGIIDRSSDALTNLLDITPYQSGGNWAWVPGAAWAPHGNLVYAVTHVISETVGVTESHEFDLVAVPTLGGNPVNLVNNVGMFAYPVPSPIAGTSLLNNTDSGDSIALDGFSIAYLQAMQPDQSETSRYRLFTIDQDGSNKVRLFPPEGEQGLLPQSVAWSPGPVGTNGNLAIALVYNGNIWIIDTGTGIARQVTGDGLANEVDWR